MADPTQTVQETDPSPRKFVAFGRLLGGLVVSLMGGITMHLSISHELTAFATLRRFVDWC
jgi:hypothetical protein